MRVVSVKTKFAENLKYRISLLKRSITHSFIGSVTWALRGAKSPAPNFVKHRLLEREFLNSGTCVETGTYLGETASRLSKKYPLVISIEPNQQLHFFVKERLKRKSNVELVLGTSEGMLPDVLRKIKNGSNVNFWLDGHFSGGFTFLGENVMPIIQELEIIASNLKRFNSVVIAIDDFRDIGFHSKEGVSRDYLVRFAQENSLSWSVELDIFFLKKEIV